jgi:hypothetical protein
MEVLMARTDSALALRVQRLAAAGAIPLRTMPAAAFWLEAQAATSASMLVLPFNRLTPFSTHATQRMWSWEGSAVPYLAAMPGSPGARVLVELAPELVRNGAPPLPAAAAPSEKLLWLPVRSLPMQAVIALAQVQRRAASPAAGVGAFAMA